MSEDAKSEYEVEQRETVAEVPGLRVRLLTLGAGQNVPWHLHTTISDTFFCMLGPMRVLTQSPNAEHVLESGDSLVVPPGVAHFVEPASLGCKFLIVQGVGQYDYVPVDAPS